jgi:uncharacterized protein (TIGR03435 family)
MSDGHLFGHRVVRTARCSGLIAVALITATMRPGAVRAQQSPNGPTFEVASIKLIDSTAVGGISFQPNGRFTATNVTLRRLILIAFGLPEYQLQLMSLPSWNISTRFQVLAMDGEPSPPDAAAQRGETRLNKMLQNLLVERFKLAVHHETRELPIYNLVLARTDARPGPKLRPSNGDCDAVIAARAAARASGAAEAPPPPLKPGERPTCAQTGVPGHIIGQGETIPNFANLLTLLLERGMRPVIDKTGLTGRFDFDIVYTPEPDPARGGLPPGVDPNGPPIFTALQEQLGLKLESTKAPYDIVVIDHAEMPTLD